MCIKNYSSPSAKGLNPRAQEWRPKNPHNTKNPPPLLHHPSYHYPAKTPALSAAAPPFLLLPRVVALSGKSLQPPAAVGGWGRGHRGVPPQQRPMMSFSFFVEGDPRRREWNPKSSDRRAAGEEPRRRERKPKRSARRAAGEEIRSRSWKPRRSAPRAAAEEPRRREWRSRRSFRRAAVFSPAAAEFSPPSSNTTTLMIKNIPNHLRRDFMLEFVDSYCKTYSLEYDFFYLPMDFRSKDNFGYAFVNFTSAQAAHKFKLVLQNFKWNTCLTKEGNFMSSRKICHITWARIQGKEDLEKRFQSTTFKCDEPSYLPVFLDPPRNGTDPCPPPPMVVGRMCKI